MKSVLPKLSPCWAQRGPVLSRPNPAVLVWSAVCEPTHIHTHTHVQTQVRLTCLRANKQYNKYNSECGRHLDWLISWWNYIHIYTRYMCTRSIACKCTNTVKLCFHRLLTHSPPQASTPNLHPSRPCIPSIADTRATGHVTYWIKPHAVKATCLQLMYCLQTDLDFDLLCAPSPSFWTQFKTNLQLMLCLR